MQIFENFSHTACKTACKHSNLLIIIYGSIPVRSTRIPLGRNSERDFCIVTYLGTLTLYLCIKRLIMEKKRAKEDFEKASKITFANHADYLNGKENQFPWSFTTKTGITGITD